MVGKFPRHGFRVLQGGMVDVECSITLTRAQWVDVMDLLLTARDAHRVFGYNYAKPINDYHLSRAEDAQHLFDEMNEKLGR